MLFRTKISLYFEKSLEGLIQGQYEVYAISLV